MNNKIGSAKLTGSIFLAVILIAGTIATILPSVQAQPYYNSYEPQYPSYKPDYKTKYSSDNNKYKSKDTNVNVNKIKCINTNLNINGNNTGDVSIGNKGQGYSGANPYDGYDNKQGKGFDCIINNNNINTNIGGVNQTNPPGPPTTTLNVTKQVACKEDDGAGLVPSIQQLSLGCDALLDIITEDQFNISVTDTNVNPSNFNGSKIGTLVTLGSGPYTVTEEPDDSIAADVATIEDIQTNVTGPIPSFSGDCTQTSIGSFSATGDIAAGGQESCNIVNNFVINVTDPCEACFNTNTALQAVIEDQLVKQTVDVGFVSGPDNIIIPSGVNTIEQLCPLLKGHTDVLIDSVISTLVLIQTGSNTAFQAEIDALIRCLLEAGVIVEANAGLTASNINTAGGLTHSISSPPTIAQETIEDDLSAMEKITKLKTQWLELLP